MEKYVSYLTVFVKMDIFDTEVSRSSPISPRVVGNVVGRTETEVGSHPEGTRLTHLYR